MNICDKPLNAHSMMMSVIMETGDDFSLYANGIQLIQRLIMLRLNEVIYDAGQQIEEMHENRRLKEPNDNELFKRVGNMVANAYVEAGIDMNVEKMTDWNKGIFELYASTTHRYYEDIKAQLDGDTHLLTVGSLLPWLEMKIRKELIGVDFPASAVAQAMSRLTAS